MKIIKKIYYWCTKTRLRKILSLTLAVLIFLTSIKYIFIPIPKISAADIYLGMNEGYGTSTSDTNSTATAFTVTNAVWKTEDLCKVDKCLYFDGTGDFVTHADDANLDMGAGGTVTIEGWFRTPDITSGTRTLVAKEESTGADGGYKIEMNSSGFLVFGIDNENTSFPSDSVTSTVAYDDNIWHHFAAVKNGATSITLYVDGVSVGTPDTSIQNDVSNDDAFYIGIYNGSSNGFAGFIDEIKILRSARTAMEVKADFLGETPSRGLSASFGSDKSWISNGLVGYWKMDENTGTSGTDYSGNGTTLQTLGNTSWVSGKFGSAIAATVDGTATGLLYDDVSSATTDLLDFSNTQSFSFSFWYKAASAESSSVVPFNKGAANASSMGYDWEINSSNDAKCKYTDGDGSGDDRASATLAIWNDGLWHQVSCVMNRSKGTYYMYIDGILAGTDSSLTESSAAASTTDLKIGDVLSSTEYSGGVDEVKIYNRALSDSEVSQLYNFAPGPVGWWKMDEGSWINDCSTDTVFDSSGNGFNGDSCPTSTGSAGGSTGKFGQAGIFDDNDDYVITSGNSKWDSMTNVTFSMWIKPSSHSAVKFIASKSVSTSDRWGFRWTDANFLQLYDDIDNAGYTGCQVVLPVNTWHYITGTLSDNGDGTFANQLYVNGISQGCSHNSTGSWNSYVGNLYIGSDQSSGTTFNGNIDDLRIYDYVRTPKQIIEDMNGGHPAPGGLTTSTVAYWNLDEGYDTTANDNSTNGNNLTLSTASWNNNGKFGKAFNGLTNVRMSRTDDADLDFAGADDATFSLWFKSDSATNPAANEYLLEKGGNIATDAIGYALYTSSSSDGLVCFGIDDDAVSFPEDSVCSTNDLYDNTWHHIVAKKTGTSRLDLYVDGLPNGTPDTSISATGTLENSATFYIGDTNGTDGTDEFLGDIDEIQIYRGALSNEQVLLLYNNSSSISLGAKSTNSSNIASNADTDSYCPPGQGTTCIPPVGEWKFNENTGTTAKDTSGNSMNATLLSSNWATGKFGAALETPVDVQHCAYATDSTGSVLDITDAITVEAWINPAQTLSTTTRIADKDYRTTWFFGTRTSGTNNLSVWLNNAERAFTSNGILPINAWSHAVFTYNKDAGGTDEVKIYLNGILIATGDYSTAIGTNDNYLAFGANYVCNNTAAGLKRLDEIKVYNYARTPEQIAWDYNHGSPQGYWQFDENTGTTTSDNSGNSYHSQTFSGDTTWTTGKFNTALTFDGTDDNVRITEGTGIDFGAISNGYTISSWIKTSANFSGNATVVAKDDGSGAFPFNLYLNSSEQACFQISDGTNSPSTCGSTALNDGLWHHLLGKRDIANDLIHIYVDGISVNSTTDTTTLTTANNDDVSIGASGTSYVANDFNGQIDDVRLFNYTQSNQQIMSTMNDNSAIKFTQ